MKQPLISNINISNISKVHITIYEIQVICQIFYSRCGVSFATETISSGRPHTSIESQMGQSTSSLSSSSTISSSSGSNHGSHNTWHGSPAHGPPNDFQFTVVGPSNSLNRYITQSQKSAQEQLQSASSRDAAKSTTAIDHGQIEPLFSINHSPPSGVSSWSKAWEKSSSWSSQTNVSCIFKKLSLFYHELNAKMIELINY